MDAQIRIVLAELRAALEGEYGERLAGLVLFGSRARGDHDPDSDIDVLVVLHGPVRARTEITRTGGIAADISLRHNVTIQRVFVSSYRFGTDASALLRNVHREGVAV